MNKQPGWRPEKALVLAVVLIGVTVLVAVILMLSGVRQGRRTDGMMPYALALLLAGGIAAYLILAYSRKLRRQQRPEWLETQAWRQGLLAKLEKGESKETPPQDR